MKGTSHDSSGKWNKEKLNLGKIMTSRPDWEQHKYQLEINWIKVKLKAVNTVLKLRKMQMTVC